MPTIDLSNDFARVLDEAVRRHGFESREELIAAGLEAIEDLNGDVHPSGQTLARIDAGLDALERGDLVSLEAAMRSGEMRIQRAEAERAARVAE